MSAPPSDPVSQADGPFALLSTPDPAPAHAFALRLGDGLALRLRERHHVDALAELLATEHEHLAPSFGWAQRPGRAEAERQVAQGLERFGQGRGWHADLCEHGRVVGAMWLHDLQRRGGSTEVGYWLRRDAQGRGLVTRAMRALHRHFFEGRGLGRVCLAIEPGHARSEAVARRLGYAPEAVLRGAHMNVSGRPVDLAFYGLLREDWDGPGADAGPVPLPRFALRVDDDLQLGLLEREDAEALHALIDRNRAHLRPWMPWAGDQDLDATRGFLEGRALPALARGEGVDGGIWWRGRLVGAAGIHSWSQRPRRGSVGYWLGADAQGRGIATRVTRALLAKAFDDLGTERVDLRAAVGNAPSRAVADRLGMRFEGVLRRELPVAAGYADMAVYAFSVAEWRARTG
ncbi:MAG: GNAT family protein [Trueperaceae bacterium]|nr:GNAT family protein [Trueperaceae bacterium]